ncbi:MAG: HAMP domain-containing histidine kinase [Gammaproteobacteria bacterium]|nr:HAMP domain-containing histidine kinase [Gammaproteobacteria bacterium]MDE2250922.1 HAMP domain-containing histidine kinase [Gammaproteobacteria bacterium]
MRAALPKSLNGYLLLGIGVITMPLLAAILHATFQIRRLTDFSQSLVDESVHTTELIQEMFERRNSLGQKAKVYHVLGSAQDLANFNNQDAELASTMGELRAALRAPEARGAIDSFTAVQREIAASVRAPPSARVASGAAAARAMPDFEPLDEPAARISRFANAQKAAELASLENQTNAARRLLFWESSLLIPLALAATLSFTLGIGRPIRQVDRAITELGGGNFSREIAVSGPVDLQRLGLQLEWLRGRLLELAQERNRFLRHMSHELKTPLANIREGAELLMDGAVGALRPGQREVAAILQENSIKLQRMIENLLSYSAWQSNSLGLDAAEFRLRPMVKQVLENQQLTLVSQRVRLDVQIEDLTLYADRGKLRLILENLLSNAIKYSPRGGTIVVRAHAAGPELVLDVADSGVGIPPGERSHIFEAFHTGRAPGGHVRGTGIGLSVVQEFVQVHRGTIEIVDGEFRGAHFRIRMPLRAEQPAPAAAAGLPAARRKAHAA